MRVLFLWLAMVMLAGSATAQDTGKLTPLPGGPALLDWVRTTLAEALDGVTEIGRDSHPNVFIVRTTDPALPVFAVTALESGPVATEVLTANFISPFRASCDPLRRRGELAQYALFFELHTVECPRSTSRANYHWIMAYKDGERAQLIALVGSMEHAAAINARGDRFAAALGMRIYPTIRSLPEALAVAQAHAGDLHDYDPSQFSLLGDGRAHLRVKALTLTGKPGTWEVIAPSCDKVRMREIGDGPPVTVDSDIAIDLQRLASLVTRQGPDLILRAGAYGTITRLVASSRPVTVPIAVADGSLAPDSPHHAELDSLLLAWERFCATASPVGVPAAPARAGAAPPTPSARPLP